MIFSLRRLLAITVKELRHITRDARIFFLVTLSPACLPCALPRGGWINAKQREPIDKDA